MTLKLNSKKTIDAPYSESINSVDELQNILEKENRSFKVKLVEKRKNEGMIRESSC